MSLVVHGASINLPKTRAAQDAPLFVEKQVREVAIASLVWSSCFTKQWQETNWAFREGYYATALARGALGAISALFAVVVYPLTFFISLDKEKLVIRLEGVSQQCREKASPLVKKAEKIAYLTKGASQEEMSRLFLRHMAGEDPLSYIEFRYMFDLFRQESRADLGRELSIFWAQQSNRIPVDFLQGAMKNAMMNSGVIVSPQLEFDIGSAFVGRGLEYLSTVKDLGEIDNFLGQLFDDYSFVEERARRSILLGVMENRHITYAEKHLLLAKYVERFSLDEGRKLFEDILSLLAESAELRHSTIFPECQGRKLTASGVRNLVLQRQMRFLGDMGRYQSSRLLFAALAPESTTGKIKWEIPHGTKLGMMSFRFW